MRRQALVHIGLVVLVYLLLISSATACPTCKDGMQTSENAQNLVTGYFWSILFMMSMPFVIFTALATYFYFQIRKARAAQLQSANDIHQVDEVSNAYCAAGSSDREAEVLSAP